MLESLFGKNIVQCKKSTPAQSTERRLEKLDLLGGPEFCVDPCATTFGFEVEKNMHRLSLGTILYTKKISLGAILCHKLPLGTTL